MIISILQEKGGAGKTTIAVNLAVCLQRMGRNTLLVDSDPQGSAREWHTRNDGTVLDVLGLDRPTLDKDVVKFKDDYEFIIIDGAPRLSTVVAKALICADIVLIPVQPSPYDIWATESLVELVKQRQDVTNGKLKAAFVVSRKIVFTKIGKEVTEVLEGYGLPVLRSYTSHRVAYAESAARGISVTMDKKYEEAGREINDLTNEILELIHGNPN